MSEGQAKVNAEASKEPPKEDGGLWGKIKSAAKWVAEKLKAAFEFVTKLLSDPGFWVSLVVAVALTALVIGTGGLAAGIVAAIVIGAISSGAGQVVSNLAAGKKWNEGLGTAIAFGALGGAVFGPLGGKVAGAIGSKIMSTAGGKAVSAAVSRVGGRVASSAAGRAASAVGRGVTTAARRGASAVRSGARRGAQAVRSGARRGAQAVRSGARRGANAVRSGARRGANAVRNAARGIRSRGPGKPKPSAPRNLPIRRPNTLPARVRPGLRPGSKFRMGEWEFTVTDDMGRAVGRSPKVPNGVVIIDRRGILLVGRDAAGRPRIGYVRREALERGPQTTHTIRQVLNMRGKERSEAAENLWNQMYRGQRHVHRPVPADPDAVRPITGSGGRHTDVTAPGGANSTMGLEIKAYLEYRTINGVATKMEVELTTELEQQIYKDAWLRAQDATFRPVWLFMGAPPGDKIKALLKEVDFQWIYVHPPKG